MDSNSYRVVCSALLSMLALAPQRGFAQSDTVRIGTHSLRPLTAGVDTVEVYRVTGDARELQRLHVVSRTAEQLDGRRVIRLVSKDGQTRTDARIDRVTHQVVRFSRSAPTDSTTFALRGNCVDGWSDFPNQPRRAIECVAAADRFGSGVLDAFVVGALPLRAGFDARIATFDAFGDVASYPVRVTGQDTLRASGRVYPAWRVERSSVASGQMAGSAAPSRMEITTTWWVDTVGGRVLQERLTVNAGGTKHETLRVLRNP
jgi:hypothetical protein